MATQVTAKSEKINRFLAALGLDTKDGPKLIQVANRNNPHIGKFDDEGWKNLCILKSDPKIQGNIKFFDIDVGFVKSTLAKVFKGRKPVIDLPMMAITPRGLKYAFGTDSYSLIEPGSPITTTVDISTTPTLKRIKVHSVTGFQDGSLRKLAFGQRCGLVTEDTDHDPDYELKHIESIDTVNKIISFVQPLEHLPIDGATFKVIAQEKFTLDDTVPAAVMMRMLEFYKDNSLGVFYMPLVNLSKDGFPTGGMEAPQEATPEMEIMNNWDIDSGNNLTQEFLDYTRLYQTDFS